MKFGSSFRKLRKEKGISISTLAGEFISKSQISRFERDESEISFQKLFYLLESISISLEEFLIISNNNEISNFKQFISQLQEAEFSNNIEFLRELYHLESKNYQKSSSKYHFLNMIMIKNSMLKCAEVIRISESEKIFLTEYLFTVETFSYYELIILSRTEYILDLHVQDNLSQK
ncbi:hypothetical protein A9Q68_04600 [Streptococcus bovimastitidis]|uniref:HTH cro/C1-type domain-containing protein n=2 Tax=Streptococcus bovimastitidis TaxID=1856638 RepID=A0A1L8MPZ1_9STRE|nr:hypothetical protein A9Q68_04600 [Streptococcus bovimastitidis]